MMKKNLTVALALCLALTTLATSACTYLAIGGITAGGLAVIDRRSTGAIADDNVIEPKIFAQIKNKYPSVVNLAHITRINPPCLSVTSYNRKVLLTGIVENEQQRQDMVRIARSQKSVERVYDYLTVKGKRGLSDYTGDAYITSKIRTALLRSQGFSPNDVKVVTYGGVTYVMGLLTPQEQLNASRQISRVSGVKQVVTLYETYDPNTGKTTAAR